ncbi:MAG TPA: FkbM family methyltransferase [Woeseiaceae bacterium]|nr:FkbM family methyltransferase [Woeseiaceae bacterium]
MTEKLHMRHRFLRCRYKSEAPSIRFLLDLPLEGGTLVDIGANVGVFAYYLSRLAGPSGTVYAFEAQPELGPHLQALAVSFGLENLRVVNRGVSSRPGVLRMHRTIAGSGQASFHHAPGGGLEEIEVPVTTLDSFFEETAHEPIRFMKCDVEGHELEVFRGAERILREDGPILLFECHDEQARHGALFHFLVGLGYDGVFFHVDRADHDSLLRNTRGSYQHYTAFDRFDYVRPGVRHRNYIFMKDRGRLKELMEAGSPA